MTETIQVATRQAVHRPTSAEEVVQLVRDAAVGGRTLDVRGNGTRAGYGNPVAADERLELGGLDGIEFYEPEELVIRLGPGVRVDVLKAMLAERGQYLPFEPPVWAGLYGTDPARATIGGTMAAALSGPRRIFTGAARDYILGVKGVNGKGELFAAGGRTVKNVTGYDVSKLMVGSCGTLAALTSLTLKLWPAPRREQTLVFASDNAASDFALCGLVLSAPISVSGAVRLPTEEGDCLAFRVEGSEAGVADHVAALRQRAERAPLRILDDAESVRFWQPITELAPLQVKAEDVVWRVNLPAGRAAFFLEEAAKAGFGGRTFADWGGNEIFCAVSPADGRLSDVASFRKLVSQAGGHATLLRAPDAVRREYGAFPAESPAIAALAARVRLAFDPMGVFSPGRMTPASPRA